MSELENIEHDKQVYTKWLCEDKSKPIRAIHWLWEYLETPHQEDNKLTEDDELDILQSFINYKRGNQPQLTIPKSIADELEKYDFELTSKGLMYRNIGGTLVEFSRVTYDEIPQLIVQTIAGNYRIVFAYLAGKALGVDLVKVV